MKTLVFDLDGTLYRGTQPIEGGLWVIDECQRLGIPYAFLTNNSMRTREENRDHMLKMGYKNIEADDFYNSAMAAAQYARKNQLGNSADYIGSTGMVQAMEENSITLNQENPDLVFIALDKTAGYKDYSRVLSHLLHGAKLVGTNKDRILAKPGGFEVGNGSVVALFEYAANTKSPDIAKPYWPILEGFLETRGLKRDDIILVGDNLETDIALGYNNQVSTVFVESGVHHREDIERLKVVPDVIVGDLGDLDLKALVA